jgi:uncharacterized protein YukE
MTDVRMKFDSMEKMKSEFDNAAKQLDESMREMQKIAKMMDDGGLLGMGGDAFRDAIMQKLLPKMKKLEEKMTQMSGDMDGAIRFTRDGESKSKSRFLN